MNHFQQAATVFGPRRINCAGRSLIREYEGLRLHTYECPSKVLTIGYGHTRGVRLGDVITAEQAEELLTQDLAHFEQAVSKMVSVPLSDNQYAALVCFAFNVGVGNVTNSTLLKLLNRGWYEQVPAQLMRWVFARGERLGGLARRRRAEAALWQQPDQREG